MAEVMITKRLEFDAGHRLPGHQSKCKHLHGHRYAMEVTLAGPLCEKEGAPDQGMLADFSEIKRVISSELIEEWDHAFFVYSGDSQLLEFLNSLKGHKTVVLEHIPTVENLALEAQNRLKPLLKKHFGDQVKLHHLRLYETPSSWADVQA